MASVQTNTPSLSHRSRSASPVLEPHCDDFLTDTFEDTSPKLYPWVSQRTMAIVDPLVQLHEEILDFFAYVQPSESERKAQHEVFTRIETVATKLWPGAEIKPFGSLTTGLWLPNSDMDLAIFTRNRMLDTRYLIRELALELNYRKMLCYQERVFHARVPILKLRDQKTAIPVDICFNVDNGVEGVRMVRAYLDRYPEAKYLTCVLKYFLRQRGLNDTYSGGVGSFMLFCTVVAGLQEHRRTSSRLKQYTLGHYFVHYLRFFGVEIDIATTGLEIEGDGKKFAMDGGSGQLLTIVCPQESQHSIGLNSYRFPLVQQAYKDAYRLLMTQPHRGRGLSPLSCLIRADKSLMDRTH